jgi:Domain of unknown function(DUF2779)
VARDNPLYFADFETVSPAIPRFAGMRPYDHILFQWSVHVQREPWAAPEHLEFLATDASDPRPAFASAQTRDGRRGRGLLAATRQARRAAATMEVADGQAAGLAWESLISDGYSESERQRKRQPLLNYCAQDTLGMVRLLQELNRVLD